MKNRINTSRMLLAASIIGIVLLSGCVGNNNTKTTPVPTETPVIAQPTPSTTPVTVITYNASDNVSKNSGHATESTKSTNTTNSTNSTSLTATGSDWCTPNSTKKVAGKDFTVVGLEKQGGTELCKIKLEVQNGSTTAYLTKSGNVVNMTSTMTSADGNASSYASSSVSR